LSEDILTKEFPSILWLSLDSGDMEYNYGSVLVKDLKLKGGVVSLGVGMLSASCLDKERVKKEIFRHTKHVDCMLHAPDTCIEMLIGDLGL